MSGFRIIIMAPTFSERSVFEVKAMHLRSHQTLKWLCNTLTLGSWIKQWKQHISFI